MSPLSQLLPLPLSLAQPLSVPLSLSQPLALPHKRVSQIKATAVAATFRSSSAKNNKAENGSAPQNYWRDANWTK